MINNKKSTLRIVLKLCVITVCFFTISFYKNAISPFSTAVLASYVDQIDDAKGEKEQLEDKKKDLEKRLAELEKEKGDILKYIEKLDKELTDLSTEIEELDLEIAQVSASLEQTKLDLEEAKKTEANQYATMKKRIQYIYENGNTNYVEILLNSENLSDLLNQMEYIEKIAEYDNDLLTKYETTKNSIADMTVQLEDELNQLNLLNEELQINQAAVESLIEDKQVELAKYESSINETEILSLSYSEKIQEQEDLIEDLLEKERLRIEEEERKRKEEEERRRKEEEERKRREEEERRRQEQLQQQQQQQQQGSSSNSNSSSGNVSKSGFMWPVPASSRITSYFGYRGQPTSGASTYHKGIDIGASTGTNIVAANSGTVVTSSYNVAAGYYIMISHGDGVYTVYMHCSKLLADVGDYVSRGDVIAKIGSTGVSTGPHLHFGLSVNGSYVDPLDYISYGQ